MAAGCLALLLWGCQSPRYAYFQPTSVARSPVLPTTTLQSADTLPVARQRFVTSSVSDRYVSSSGRSVAVSAGRHRNPDSAPKPRLAHLLRSSEPVPHVAPQRQLTDWHSPKRKTYKPAVAALGVAILSVGVFFVPLTTPLAWGLAAAMPLTATLLGVASLTTISRNRDRFRGKGWAMAAILIGTGIVGMSLLALAALSASNVVWEK